MQIGSFLAVVAVSGLVLAGAARADTPAVNAALIACAGMVEDAQQLACYDKAVGQLSAEAKRITAERSAAAAQAAAVAAAAQAKADSEAAAAKAKADAEAKTAAFGAERINRNVVDTEKMVRLDAKVSETMFTIDGMVVLLLDNGQLWRQVTGAPVPPIRTGDAVVIEPGKVGGFQITLVRQHRAFNVKRLK